MQRLWRALVLHGQHEVQEHLVVLTTHTTVRQPDEERTGRQPWVSVYTIGRTLLPPGCLCANRQSITACLPACLSVCLSAFLPYCQFAS